MNIKLFFLWLILLLFFFSKPSFSAPGDKPPPVINSVTEIEKRSSKMSDSISLILNQLENNTKYIKKNALNINTVNANNNDLSNRLHEKADDNKSNISNLYFKLKASKQLSESIQGQVAKTNKSTQQNEQHININKEGIQSNQKSFSEFINNNKDKYKLEIEKINRKSGLTSDYLDRFWVLLAAVLVFFMQAGFKTFEAGMVRKEHDDNVAIKNILDWLIISLVYFTVGFGLMFGDSYNGFFGTNLFSPTMETMQQVKNSIGDQYLGLEFFLYQLAFAATAATIVSGAMSERIALIPYIVLSVFIGIIVYPFFGHWAWGGTYYLNDHGWLFTIGFRDFAGSTVVHSIGAWIALAGIIVIGARNGRYDKDGNINKQDFVPSNLGYSTLGVLILWFGWWGFNGGSQLKYDESIASIIANTILAGSAAGMTAFFHALSKSRDKFEIFPKLLGGILGGLVAITACCNSVSSWEAIFIGAVAGLVHNYSHDLLMLKLKLDDPVGAVAVHGFCGVWGTMCVAFFGQLDADFFAQNSGILFSENGLFQFMADSHIRLKQALIQLIGIVAAFLYAFTLSYMFFKMIRIIPGIGLRVLPSAEKVGSILGISK